MTSAELLQEIDRKKEVNSFLDGTIKDASTAQCLDAMEKAICCCILGRSTYCSTEVQKMRKEIGY
jgi:hypothetical protein